VSYFTPAWSPDGSELVVASYNGVNFGLDIIRLDGSESRQLLSRPRHRATYSEPAWSPDGKWIAVTTFTESGSQIFIVPVEGGTLIPVTEVGAAFRQPVWNRAGISGKIE
jgi:TolB protein